MTTRAGILSIGLGGLLLAVLWYPLYRVAPGLVVQDWPSGSILIGAVAIVIAACLTAVAGGLAARWGGASNAVQCVGLGALAGSVAALIVFCGLGASAAGTVCSGDVLRSGFSFSPQDAASQAELRQAISHTMVGVPITFWGMWLIGVALGAAGGLCLRPRQAAAHPFEYDRAHPQMALNVSITAVLAAALTVILAAALFRRASEFVGQLTSTPLDAGGALTTALLLYLASHAALTLVTRHEARQADHQCGLDEVKMAAYVGIAAPLALGAGLLVTSPRLMLQPVVILGWLISLGMSAGLVQVLCTLILPRRALLPPPLDARQAVWFGSIAQSRGQNLLVLCAGCGLAMMAPLNVAVVSVALNVWLIPVQRLAVNAGSAELVRRLYRAQAAVSLGSMAGAGAILAGIYLFYSALGRWTQRHRTA